MAQTGYTPIQLYLSSTAAAVPLAANLAAGELAINTVDGKLYYKSNAGVVTLLASSTTVTNSFSAGTTGLTPNTATTGAVTLAGTLITTNGGTGLSTYTAGDLSYFASGTALTKLAIGTSGYLLTSSGTAPQWSNSISIGAGTFTSLTDSGLTSGRVTYAGTGGLLQDSANLTFNGTTLTANTIGAFTLGGTIAGGGNQLNNVIIGASTPLAGSFTTLSASSTLAVGASVTGALSQFESSSLKQIKITYPSVASYFLNTNASGNLTIDKDGSLLGTFSSTGLAITGSITATTTASIGTSFNLGALTLSGSQALGITSATTGDFLSSGGGNSSTYNGLAIVSNSRAINTQANSSLPSWIVDIGGRAADGTTYNVNTQNKFRVAYVAAGTSYYNAKNGFTVDSGLRIGFGNQMTTSDRLIDASFSGATTTGASQFGIVLNPTYPNTATSNLFNFYTGANLTAGATLTNAYGIYLEAGNYSGSTVTNKYGIYQAGTADNNFFNGNVSIGTGSQEGKLTVATGNESSGQVQLAQFRTEATGSTTYNAGVQIYGTASATAVNRNVAIILDADGANAAGGDYIVFQKNGNNGAAYLYNANNNAFYFGTNGQQTIKLDGTNTYQIQGRSSNAYTIGNVQEWAGAVGSIANGASFSLFAINNQYDMLCYDLNIFANSGGFFSYKSAGVFGYNGFTNTVLGTNISLTITKTGTLYNETMTITNNCGSTVNEFVISLRVWGYGARNNISTGGADLVTSSYVIRQN